MEHLFSVGDKVIFTNEFGVCFGVKTITSLETRFCTRRDDEGLFPCYHYEGTDTPWFPSDEKHFVEADRYDKLAHLYGDDRYLQRKHGRPTTLEERASLLDLDYDL